MYKINRYPTTSDRSLKAHSAADEYLLQHTKELTLAGKQITIYNDRFGYLSTHLAQHNPTLVTSYKSQEKSILANLQSNDIDITNVRFQNHLGEGAPTDIALVRIPKSLDLLRLYFAEILASANDDTVVVCSFMTKHFTKQLLTVAGEHFEDVNQSLAWKKSRLLLLSKPKQKTGQELIHEVSYQDKTGTEHVLRQYYGVFSAKHIDYATQFLLEHLDIDDTDNKILDLASGNGVIAYACRLQNKEAEIHLLDDSQLAIASSQLNLTDANTTFHHSDTMNELPDSHFDLVVCNPPFHFEHENTIDIALALFKGARRVLSATGRFVCVANLHLNYKTHLEQLFTQVDSLAQNDKFVVYQCWK